MHDGQGKGKVCVADENQPFHTYPRDKMTAFNVSESCSESNRGGLRQRETGNLSVQASCRPATRPRLM